MRVVLIGWKQADVDARAAELRAGGVDVEASVPVPGSLLPSLRAAPPDVLIIDLDRMPSHGKAVGVAMKDSKSLRGIPLVYAGGVEEKVAGVRELIPDALYVSWLEIREAVRRAPSLQLTAPAVKTRSASTAVPLVRKLGIKPGMVVALDNAPRSFFRSLGSLADGTFRTSDMSSDHNMAIYFVEDVHALQDACRHKVNCPLWIAWPKQTARTSELKQETIRELAATFGLVDYKICAIDETWSGMLFSRRRPRS